MFNDLLNILRPRLMNHKSFHIILNSAHCSLLLLPPTSNINVTERESLYLCSMGQFVHHLPTLMFSEEIRTVITIFVSRLVGIFSFYEYSDAEEISHNSHEVGSVLKQCLVTYVLSQSWCS